MYYFCNLENRNKERKTNKHSKPDAQTSNSGTRVAGLPRRTCQRGGYKRGRLNPQFRQVPWRRKWHPTPAFLSEESHGQRGLVGYSLWGREELDRIEHLNTSTTTGSSDTRSLVQFSSSVVSDSLRPHGLQDARPPYSLPTPGVYSNSCPLSW